MKFITRVFRQRIILESSILFIVAQGVTLLTSVFLSLFLPVKLGLNYFADWQMYLLLISFSGFFHFGLIDGFYVRTQRRGSSDSYKNLFRIQFYYLAALQLLITIILFFLIKGFNYNINNSLIYYLFVFNFINNLSSFMGVFWQLSGKIKLYANINLVEKSMYLLLILVYLFSSYKNLELLIIFSLMPKLVILIIQIYVERQSLFGSLLFHILNLKIIRANHFVGLAVLFSNILGILIIAMPRLIVGDLFGKICFSETSIALSLATVVVSFFSQISLAIYPFFALNRPDVRLLMLKKLQIITNRVSVISFFFVPFLIVFLKFWFGPRSNVPNYFLMLFPMMIYETKYYLIYLPLLKFEREQTLLIIINLIIFICLIGTTFMGVHYNSIILVLFFISCGYGLRTFFFEMKYIESNERMLKSRSLLNLILPWCLVVFIKLVAGYLHCL